MPPRILGPALALLTAAGALCQSAEPQPAFEVASIRSSKFGRASGEGNRRENIQFTPDSLTMRNVSLRTCMRWAYHVSDYQITAPDWISVERFDITAKAPGAVAEEQLRAMLQALLAERFKLTLHRVTKELPAFLLLVGKNGPKFQESTGEGDTDIQPDRSTMSITVHRAPLSQLVDMLSQMLRTPVVDMTGLKGKYDIKIDAAKYLADIQPGGPPPDLVSLISMGIQQELGLKLESRKTTLDLLIFDSAEKVPVEN